MNETSETDLIPEISEPSQSTLFQTPTLSSEDFLAELSRLLANGLDSVSKTQEVNSFMRCSASLVIKEYRLYSSRTSKDSSTMTGVQPLVSCSQSWMRWGTMLNGNCLTARTLPSHSIERGSSFWDMREIDPDPKYSLSDAQKERMWARMEANQQAGRGFAPTFLQPSMPTTTKAELPDHTSSNGDEGTGDLEKATEFPPLPPIWD